MVYKKGHSGDRFRKVKINNNNKKYNKKEYTKIAFLGILLFTIICGTSYAFLSQVITSKKTVEVTAGTFVINFKEKNTINLKNAVPMTDQEGMNTESYVFSVNNTGSLDAKYDISLEENSNNTLDRKYVKYSIKEGDGEWSSPTLLSTGLNLKTGRSLGSGATDSYEIKIWLDESATNEVQGKTYGAKVVVNAVQTNSTVTDFTTPIILLNGPSTVKLNQGDTFNDLGVQEVKDDKDKLSVDDVEVGYEYYDGENTVEVSSIDTSKVGIYYIYYKISDSSGNVGVSTRTVIVSKKNTGLPTISLVGDEVVTIKEGDSYTESGAIANDSEDGSLTDKIVVIGSVNTKVAGTYVIKYLVEDSDSNIASVTRTVIVEPSNGSIKVDILYDTSNIAETLVSISSVSNASNVKYAITNDDKKPSDKEFKDLTDENGKFIGTVSFKKNGKYYLWIKDSYGNIFKKIIVIDKLDETKPTCKFKTTGYVGIGSDSKISLVCTDIVDIKEKYLLKSDFKISNEDVIDSFDISAPSKVDNGYEWYLTISAKKLGTFKLILLKDVISDGVDNKNDEITSDDIKISELVLDSDSSVSLDINGNNTYTIKTSGTNVGSLSYSSSDDSIAKVSDNGVITGVSPGVAKIVVKENNGGAYRTIKVDVSKTLTATFVKNGVGVEKISSSKETCKLTKDNKEICNITSVPTISVSNGYQAIGWNTDKTAHNGYMDISLSEDTTFYSISKKADSVLTAIFDSNNGSAILSKEGSVSCSIPGVYNDEEQATSCSIDVPTITGKNPTPIVLGFSTSSSSKKAEISSGSKLTLTDKNANTTWYAITTNEDITYTAKFIKNDGNGVVNNSWSNKTCTIEKTYNGLAQATSCTIDEIPTIEVSSGYQAIGWNTDKTAHVGLESLVLSNDSNFYTIVKKLPVTYTATLHKSGNGVTAIGANSISCTTKETYNGEKEDDACVPSQKLPSITVDSGYQALGWSQDSSAKVKASDTMATDGYIGVGESITLVNNIDLYSISKKDDVTYSVTFDSNGATLSKEGVLSCTIDGSYNNDTQIDSCSVDVPTITREGFDIIGFSTDSNNTDTDSSTHIKAGSSLKLSSSNDKKTYYANTKKDVTVTWNANGATLNTLTTSKTIWNKNSSVVITAPEITRDGYEIVGWSKDPNGNDNSKDLVKVGSDITISSNDSYYAITKKVANATFYYYNGTKQVSEDASCTLYNKDDVCNIKIPNSVVNSAGPNSTLYKGISNKTSNTTLVSEVNSNTLSYYAVYDNNIDVNFYYYDGNTQAVITKSGVRGAVSDGTNYKVSDATINVPNEVSESSGIDSSVYQGLSTSTNSSDKTSSITTANSDYYAYYKNTWQAKFNNQNDGNATIGATSGSCDGYVTSNGTSYVGATCQVTLPSISVTNDYKITGWNTDKDATSGTMPGQKVTIGKDTVNDSDGITTNYYTILGKGAITRTATFNKNGAASQTDSSNQASTAATVTRSCIIGAISNIVSQTQETTCNITTPTIVGSSNTPTVLGYNTTSSATIANVNQNTAISLSSDRTYYAITKKDAVTFTANWNANGATLSSTTQSSCNIAATYNGTAQATSCTVTAPTITAPTNTPTILGYNTSASSNSNNSSYNTTSKLLTLNSSNTRSTWYAQTRKDAVNYTVSSYEKGSNVSSVGAKTDANSKCTINATYNGATQATSCTVTAPSITANTGYTSVGWSLTSGATTGSSVITLNSSNTGKAWYANATANSYTINYYDGTTLKGSSSAKVDTYPTLTKASSLSLSKTGYTFKGWATTNGGTVVYTDGQKLTTNLATTAGATVNLYAVWKDEIAPVCSFSGASATTTQNTTTITLSCTDSGSGVVQKTLTTTDFTTTANGSVTAVGAPTKITNGYSYTVTLKGLSVGTFTVSLKAGLIADAGGNSNAAVTSGNVTVNGRTYTVTFSKGSNVSAISSTSSSCTTTGSSLTCTIGTYPTITVATGYSASTWYDSTAKKDTGIASGGSGSGYAIGQDTTMTAQAKANTYKIYFSANGGTGAPDPITRTYGQDVTFPTTVPTKTGYTFNGWLYYGTGDSSSTATSTATKGTYKAGGVASSSCSSCIPWDATDTTYVAIWTVNSYTIKYDANGGTGAPTDQSFVYNSGAKISTTKPTRTGYTFVNWKYGNTTLNPGDAVPTGWTNFTLQAQWTVNSYTMTYDYNYNVYDEDTSKWTYQGQTAKSSDSGYDNTTSVSVYSNGELWTGLRIPIDSILVLKDTNYLLSVRAKASASISGNLRVYAPTHDSSNNVISFNYGIDINSSNSNSSSWNYFSYKFNSGSYAKFSTIFIDYDKANQGPTYVSDIRLVQYSDVSKNYDTTLSELPSPSRVGYKFNGWYTQRSGGIQVSASTSVPASDSTYYAQWGVNSYTVTYDKNGGSSVSKASASVNYNSAIDLTPTASKSGYEFIGWNTDKNATTALSSLKMGTSNVTLYAIYKKIVTVPTNSLCSNPTYSGGEQNVTSVTSGDGYTLSGYKGTAAGSYTVIASLSGFSRWSDGTTANKTFTCSIGKKSVTVTASSGSKTYDGSALSNTTGCSVTSGRVISGHSVTCSNSGSITNKGSATNTLSSVVIKSGTTDVSGNYSITKANGKLTVNARATTCTSGSSSRGYNGSALTNTTGGSCTNLVTGHSATFSGHKGTITNVGSVANTFGSVVIKSGTTDVSGNYSITKANGTLTVSKVNATCPTTTAYSGNFNNAAHSIGVSGGSGGTIQYSSDNSNWSTTNPSRTVSGSQTTYVRVVGDSNHNTVTCTSRTITINPVTVKAIFSPNGATLTAQTQSASSGGVASNCSTSSGVVTCLCSIGNSSGCGVTSPAITAPSNSPTVVGFGTSAGSHSNSWTPKSQKTIYYNTGDATYYAQTKHTASYTGTFTGTTEPGISSISSTSVSCSVTTTWNNATPSTTCSITSPTITATTGNTVAGWYNSSGSKVAASGGSITLGSNQTFTAKANITAAGVTYSDTYSMGCSTVQCAIDKINTLLK